MDHARDSGVARLYVMVGQTFPYRYTTVYAIIISYVHLLTRMIRVINVFIISRIITVDSSGLRTRVKNFVSMQ